MDLIPGLGKSFGEENGNPFQYSCLKNSMGRGAWWTPVYGVIKEQVMTEHTLMHIAGVRHCVSFRSMA